ncbi:matrixin family metalloprotease [Aliiroseovarius sp. 2305UL8-7]|uniref:matrixin family metalloprotease n=1 Tax=Aliiroseovarius conchicola TaxID=3121637 RepID=UPI00352745CE
MPSLLAGQTNTETLEPPAEDFGCTTLDTFPDSLEVTDFSPSQRELLDTLQFTDFGTFLFSKRWRKVDGLTPNGDKITLGCHFFNGNPSQQQTVIDAASDWLTGELGNFIDFRFGVDRNESQIRIQLGGNRNNSYVGRDNNSIPKNRQTMNLANFNSAATVKHEFGHALGLRHEHRFPGAIEFREDVVVSEMRDKHGWTTAQTYRNILTPLGSSAKCIGDPELNEKSIMMYTIPRRWTVDGKRFSRAGVITERDRNCLWGVYSA